MVSVTLNTLCVSLSTLEKSTTTPSLSASEVPSVDSLDIQGSSPSLPARPMMMPSVLRESPFRVCPENSGLLMTPPEGSDIDPLIRNLEKGVQDVLHLVRATVDRPVLIGVYGWPNSGKSYFMARVREALSREKIECSAMGGAPDRALFNRLAQEPEYFRAVMLFHCGWARGDHREHWTAMRSHEDPNVLAEQVLGRSLHANIAIYNSLTGRVPEGAYDLIIQNPDTRLKR